MRTGAAAPPRFLADSMLGKLARWLILLGYDARYAGSDGRSDKNLQEEAAREGRVFLTRDTGIPEVDGLRMIVIRPQRFEDQLRLVFDALKLKARRDKLFSRCTYCNKELESVPRQQALPLMPPLVRGLDTPFHRCPSCARMYWNGTHTERTVLKIKRLGIKL